MGEQEITKKIFVVLVTIAQGLERSVVIREVVGSRPTSHPCQVEISVIYVMT